MLPDPVFTKHWSATLQNFELSAGKSLAELLKELGVLTKGQYIHANRATLVAQFEGQTAPKVQKKVESALGGLLFVDEAYQLKQGSQDMYGQEALGTLMELMESHRHELVVVFAGCESWMHMLTFSFCCSIRYPTELQKLWTAMDGLEGRFD